MMDTTRAQNITSNLVRAYQAKSECDKRVELRHLLFAAQDIPKILEEYRNGIMGSSEAEIHIKSLVYTVVRLRELINDGI